MLSLRPRAEPLVFVAYPSSRRSIHRRALPVTKDCTPAGTKSVFLKKMSPIIGEFFMRQLRTVLA